MSTNLIHCRSHLEDKSFSDGIIRISKDVFNFYSEGSEALNFHLVRYLELTVSHIAGPDPTLRDAMNPRNTEQHESGEID